MSFSYLGDALELLNLMPDNSIDMAIIDPPYNMAKKKGLKWAFSSHTTLEESWDQFTDKDYLNFCWNWLIETHRVVKPNGNMILFGTYHNIYLLGFLSQKLNLKILNSIVWFKPNAQPNITCRMLTESTEQMIWVCNEQKDKAKKWTFHYQDSKQYNEGKQLRNLWSFPVTAKKERIGNHPTQKPLALYQRLVHLMTDPGDWVLDPFAGVGTTGEAALSQGRQCVLLEKDKNYFEAQKKRLKHFELTFSTQKKAICQFDPAHLETVQKAG